MSVTWATTPPEQAAALVKPGAQIYGKCQVAVTIDNEPNGFAPNTVLAQAFLPTATKPQNSASKQRPMAMLCTR
ncbi:hypothetical protein CVS29_16450 [Arthrobacter psychrochitiniphilus]|uniref:Uncharacterized protein n=1 Tax=Arthrobacter psychrochitiniphilus TaxID=291045 RepID=A0A2V3DPT5_9MICC|nr:hypothetical protein CVS29_16450 [Arthrobacter psychrochitiniphilus]